MTIQIKRVYEDPEPADGRRILVDRLWPRGLTKEKASVDLWLREIAPSTELRRWFNHDPARWVDFKARYHAELKEKPEQVARVKEAVKVGAVTLVYGAKDEACNQAVALLEFLGG